MNEIIDEPMRGLSLKQPWLYAITNLGKRIENRTWTPPNHMLGKRIALHASKKRWPVEWRTAEIVFGYPITVDVPTGAIVASAVIVKWFNRHDKQPIQNAKWWEEQKMWWFPETNGWILDLVYVLDEPIPYKGMLGLWKVDKGVHAEINRQLVRDGVLRVQI